MIPILESAGYRVLAPDLIGFGKSDKPSSPDYLTTERLVDWFCEWMESLDIRQATIVGQDWGGIITLRVLARYANTDRIAAYVAAGTVLPTGDPSVGRTPYSFYAWKTINRWTRGLQPHNFPLAQTCGRLSCKLIDFSKRVLSTVFFFIPRVVWTYLALMFYMLTFVVFGCPDGPGGIVAMDVHDGKRRLTKAEIQAYNAPYPDKSYTAALRALPDLVCTDDNDPLGSQLLSREENKKAWEILRTWNRPFLTVFGTRDHMLKGVQSLLIKVIPGAKNHAHTTLDAGHFIQESAGEELAEIVRNFLSKIAERR
jgi:haloalkane dehalogenase